MGICHKQVRLVAEVLVWFGSGRSNFTYGHLSQASSLAMATTASVVVVVVLVGRYTRVSARNLKNSFQCQFKIQTIALQPSLGQSHVHNSK